MKKDNIKKLAIVVGATVMVSGLALALNGNLNRLGKMKSSVIDPVTGDSCTTEISGYSGEFEPQEFHFLELSDYSYTSSYTTGYVSSDIYELQSRSQTHCPNGYRCENKPQITPMEVDDPECTTISADDVSTSDGDSVQDELEDLYEAYNHPDFCPNNYCVPDTYEISLDSSNDFGGTVVSTGTTKIYEKYNTAFYLDEEETKEMTDSSNPITTPVVNVSVTYDGNNQGASFVGSPTAVQTPFNRYEHDSTNYPYYDYIDANGFNHLLYNQMYYSSSYYGETYTEGSNTLHAVYEEGDLVLPTITKTDHICYWNVGTEKNTFDQCDYSDIVNGSGDIYIYSDYDSASCIRGGRTVKVNTNIVATAVCLYKPTFTVSYNANGGSGTTASHTCVHDETCTLSSNGFSKSGHIFLGWKKGNTGDTLQPGANITNVVTSGTVTYYAQWKEVDGTTKSFTPNSNCSAQTYTAPSNGTYLLEVCGAQGGSVSYSGTTESGGLGGCAKGKVSLSAGQTIYVFVGKQGTMTYGNGNQAAGGCNGGGSSYTSGSSEEFVCSGGGATHISKSNSTIANAGNNLLIVGGGGGGAYLYFNAGGFDFGGNGGNGGGETGSAGSVSTSDGTWKAAPGDKGYQNAGGSVGGTKGQGGIAGGGGYYGGGAAQAQPIIGGETGRGAGAGGGSGYVGGVSSSSWTSSCANSGNYKTGDGCAKITKQ